MAAVEDRHRVVLRVLEDARHRWGQQQLLLWRRRRDGCAGWRGPGHGSATSTGGDDEGRTRFFDGGDVGSERALFVGDGTPPVRLASGNNDLGLQVIR